MQAAGWVLNVLNDCGSYANFCAGIPFSGYTCNQAVGSVSTTFKGAGVARLNFGNCFNNGITNVYLNNRPIGSALANQKSTTVKFNYKPGDRLRLEEVNMGIVAINSFQVVCYGKNAADIIINLFFQVSNLFK